MNDEARDKLHERVARRLHGPSQFDETVLALENLRQKALRGRPLPGRKAAAETYRSLTGRKP